MVEMHKQVYQNQTNNLDVKTQNCCEFFLKILKGVVFYNVPQITKDATYLGPLKNMKSFDQKMKQL